MTRLLLLLVVAVSWLEIPAAASPALSAGELFSCALDGGRVACWGFNRHGQLGDGTYVQRAAPVRVAGITDALQVASGVDHACAVRKTGEVMCWGDNTQGQLGDGSTTDRTKPVAVAGLSDAVEVAAGHWHSCARRKSGAVSCWGSNAAGQLGDGTRTTHPRPVAVAGLTKVAEISAGGDDSCARLTDGKVTCWGTDARGETGTPPSRSTMDVFEIVVGTWDGPKGGGDIKETVYAQTHPMPLAIADATAIEPEGLARDRYDRGSPAGPGEGRGPRRSGGARRRHVHRLRAREIGTRAVLGRKPGRDVWCAGSCATWARSSYSRSPTSPSTWRRSGHELDPRDPAHPCASRRGVPRARRCGVILMLPPGIIPPSMTSTPRGAVSDLTALLRTMEPELHDGVHNNKYTNADCETCHPQR